MQWLSTKAERKSAQEKTNSHHPDFSFLVLVPYFPPKFTLFLLFILVASLLKFYLRCNPILTCLFSPRVTLTVALNQGGRPTWCRRRAWRPQTQSGQKQSKSWKAVLCIVPHARCWGKEVTVISISIIVAEQLHRQHPKASFGKVSWSAKTEAGPKIDEGIYKFSYED